MIQNLKIVDISEFSNENSHDGYDDKRTKCELYSPNCY